jgi:hypothetical protein
MIKREITFYEIEDYQPANRRWVLCINEADKISKAYFDGKFWSNATDDAIGLSGIIGWCYQ